MNNDNLLRNVRSTFCNKNIVIYGCGMFGRTLSCFLEENRICKVLGFIKSYKSEETIVLGKPVFFINDFVRINLRKLIDNDIYIAVGTSKKYAPEVLHELGKRGIGDHIELSEEEWSLVIALTRFDDVWFQKNIAVLMYHRVSNNPYNFWNLNVSPRTFEKHMCFLSKYYRVISLSDDWEKTTDAHEKYIVITFDDGYMDNYVNALPILERYGIPATFFVSTELVDTNEMYWWDELEKIFIIDKYRGSFFWEADKYSVYNDNDAERTCMRIRNIIKNTSGRHWRLMIDELRYAMGIEKSYTEELRSMNISELKELDSRSGMTIGCHTVSHLSMNEKVKECVLRDEVYESKKRIIEITGHDVDCFAYPFGGEEDRSKKAERIIKECGFEKVVIVKDGNTSIRDELFSIPRYMISENTNFEKKVNSIWGLYG